MPFRITHMVSDDKLCQHLSWPVLEQVYPREHLECLIHTHVKQTTYVRKLSVIITIYVLICWNLYLRHSLGAVFRTLTNPHLWLADHLRSQDVRGGQAPLTVRIIEYRLDPSIADQLEQITPSRMHSNSSATNPQVHHVHRLLTTLLDVTCAPAKVLIQCYHERWEVEEAIDETRNQQRISQQPLRSRTPDLVLQELYALLLAHHLVRRLMGQAAQTQLLDPDRISFTASIQMVGEAIVHSTFTSAQQVPRLVRRVYADLTTPGTLVAPRHLRFNCRVVKHICTRFRRKRPEHHNLTFKHTFFLDLLLI